MEASEVVGVVRRGGRAVVQALLWEQDSRVYGTPRIHQIPILKLQTL